MKKISYFLMLVIISILIEPTIVGAATEEPSADVNQYSIKSVEDFAKAQNDIYRLPVAEQESEFSKLGLATPEDILSEVQDEAIKTLEENKIEGIGIYHFISDQGLVINVKTTDYSEDENGNIIPEIQARSLAVKNNITKPFGARRYDADINLGTVRFVFSTHFNVSSSGLTLNYVSCDVYLNLSAWSYGGERTQYEDSRAEKVGYDINGVGVARCGIKLTVGGVSFGPYVDFYTVGTVKLVSLNTTGKTSTVNEKFDIIPHSKLSSL